MKKNELNELADDIRKDCIDKYVKAFMRIFADKGCDKIITNYTGQLNSLENMSTITVKYMYKCGENIIIRWTNGINEVDSNFSQLSLSDACYLFDHVMKICDGIEDGAVIRVEQVEQLLLELAFQMGVQGGERLVEHQDARFRRQHAR